MCCSRKLEKFDYLNLQIFWLFAAVIFAVESLAPVPHHSPSPAPYHPTPSPYHYAPYSPTPAPYTPTPAPYTPTPAPYAPSPAPYHHPAKPYHHPKKGYCDPKVIFMSDEFMTDKLIPTQINFSYHIYLISM